MRIDPEFITIGALFDQRRFIFEVPKYQRGYAWDDEQVEEFCHDLECLIERNISGTNEGDHFFGGILCAQQDYPGSIKKNYIIDGQQRLATTVLLAARLVNKYNLLGAKRIRFKSAVTLRVDSLKRQFLVFENRRNMEPEILQRMVLSRYDAVFYQALLEAQGSFPAASRESHRRLLSAAESIDSFLNRLTSTGTIERKIEALIAVERVLNEKCFIVHLAANTVPDAYRLFQVMNDRGLALNEADLLRAYTLGLLDTSATQAELTRAENIWDEIQKDPHGETQDHLRWYYAAKTGMLPNKHNLYEEFCTAFFKSSRRIALDAEQLVAALEEIKTSVEMLRCLSEGRLHCPGSQASRQWRAAKLHLLVRLLAHKHAMPLLLAATVLKEREFEELLEVTTRFFFRYKIVCNQHVTPMTKIYLKYAHLLSNQRNKFRIHNYKVELDDLLSSKADDTRFADDLRSLRYSEEGGNRELKYLLVAIEEHWQWIQSGATNSNRGIDKLRPFDFDSATIEHVYPRAAALRTTMLEPVKHNLGNLTILTSDENGSIANASFSTKKPALAASPLHMNQEIGAVASWNESEVNKRGSRLIAAAIKIFSVKP